MDQQIIMVDNFYDIAHQYHKSFFEDVCLITDETKDKLQYLLEDYDLKILQSVNEVLPEESKNPITCNIAADWIAVIYLTMPSECVFKQGLSFYTHKKTRLDKFPNENANELFGFTSIEDVHQCFDSENEEDWIQYSNIFVKYNRLVLFRADYWHSYGTGFGTDLNNSMIYQKILIANGYKQEKDNGH